MQICRVSKKTRLGNLVIFLVKS